MQTVIEWLERAMSEENVPLALAEVTSTTLTSGIRMRFPKVYAVQIMLSQQIRPLSSLLCSHLATFAAEAPHKGRTLYVDLQSDPATQALKDMFLALRSWIREVMPGAEIKAYWAPRWVLCHSHRGREVYGGIKNGSPYITSILAEKAGMELTDLQAELAVLFH